jgi:OOP family OmpA-OmpF porin
VNKPVMTFATMLVLFPITSARLRTLAGGGMIALMALLSGCAGQTERYVLLPQSDGSASSIVIKSSKVETALSTPYAAVESQAGKPGNLETLTAAQVQARYAAVMNSLPQRPRTYAVLFELGSDRLTAASRKFLEQAITDIRQFPAGEFVLIGHADDIGSDASNQALSVRRAQLIERELRRAGIDPLSIEVLGKGARELPYPSRKGVPEPRNRFVEIKLR